jgi:hypothetical protein
MPKKRIYRHLMVSKYAVLIDQANSQLDYAPVTHLPDASPPLPAEDEHHDRPNAANNQEMVLFHQLVNEQSQEQPGYPL